MFASWDGSFVLTEAEYLVRAEERLCSPGEGPAVLVIDDLHLADNASLRLLGRLLPRPPGSRPAVVAALVPHAGAAPGREVIGELLPRFDHQLTLAPFGVDEVRAMAARELGTDPEPGFVHACWEATAGIPSVVQGVLDSVRASGTAPDGLTAARIPEHVPRELGRAVLADIAEHGDEVRSTAVAVAVLSGQPSFPLLSHATALGEDTVADAVHILDRLGILVNIPRGPRFPAPALATAVADEVPPGTRRELHTRAARYLLESGAPWDSVTPHLLRGCQGEQWVAEALLRAAEEVREHDSDSSIACLRRALREPLRDDVRASALISLGEAELERCARTAVRSLRCSLRLRLPPATHAQAARSLATTLFALNRYPEGIDVLRDAIDHLRPLDPDHALRAEVDLVYAQITHGSFDAPVVDRVRELSASPAPGKASEHALEALLALREVMTGGTARLAVTHAQRALAHGVTPKGDASFVYTGAVLALAVAGRPDVALSRVEASMERQRGRGSGLARGYVHTLRAGVHHRLGNVDDCLRDARAALEALGSVGAQTHANHSVAMWADALVRQGHADEADQLLARKGLNGTLAPHWANDFTTLVRGRVRRAQGRLRQALADFLDSGERSCARGMGNPAVLPWRSEAALTHALLDEHEPARRLADEELRLARAWGVPETIGSALRAAGVVAGGDEGTRLLGEAVALLETTNCRHAYAQALLDRGMLLVRAGAPDAARTHLQQALKVAQRCGAVAVVRHAEEELLDSGYRPASQGARGAQGAAALTRSERRVALLAAQGRTNRAIADELFVELRTVEMHLSRTYRKLGITGRAGLADALGT
ncbi:helix-turn-helix transcriptional regulator [Streptomyces actuosus]|uniref:Helix-turn-helix transcriptional regulator n=2 Tax=Streptomyces actuosus TaxID=1885 RepID=A0ABS2VVC2_STRAS|nr:LuxR C-terminal-related transcriptional regulator [Streptomyces actuosus]MBN0047096.1 helix-turn-helix transcriptional regulator [Streptomyces actuosus]